MPEVAQSGVLPVRSVPVVPLLRSLAFHQALFACACVASGALLGRGSVEAYPELLEHLDLGGGAGGGGGGGATTKFRVSFEWENDSGGGGGAGGGMNQGSSGAAAGQYGAGADQQVQGNQGALGAGGQSPADWQKYQQKYQQSSQQTNSLDEQIKELSERVAKLEGGNP